MTRNLFFWGLFALLLAGCSGPSNPAIDPQPLQPTEGSPKAPARKLPGANQAVPPQ
jgi:hypothetical protein